MGMKDAGLLVLRAGVGSMLAMHGAQKLTGLERSTRIMDSLGLRPGLYWAGAAAAGEFGGGVLMALGLLQPLGSIGAISAMAMAAQKVHMGKPFLANAGGPEMPALFSTVALAILATGSGDYSADKVLGITLPRWFSTGAALAAAGVVLYGMLQEPDEPHPDPA